MACGPGLMSAGEGRGQWWNKTCARGINLSRA
jgi:hypothetical protein